MHKMPYKHIATTLKKTELACRLHYHQLSFGNKRRRRTSSMTSFPSLEESPVTPSEGSRPGLQRRLPSFSSIGSPEGLSESAAEPFKHPQNPSQIPSQSHIPILPKPFPHSRSAAPPSTRGLRLITEDIEQYEKKPVIDMSKLDKIYDAHRLHFWSMIARTYGCNLSPAALEEAWCRAHSIDSSNLPPTPTASPESSRPASSVLGAPFSAVAEYSKGFTSINRPYPTPKSAVSAPTAIDRGAFSISALLTEDKEVRSPSQEKRLRDCEMT